MITRRRKASFLGAAVALAGGAVAVLVVPATATNIHSARAYARGGAATSTASSAAALEAADTVRLHLRLAPTNATIAACMPKARVAVAVALAEEKTGRDLLRVKATGLLPNTTFTVFLVQKPADPFGAVEYVGDLESNRAGTAQVDLRAITEEAFASTVVKGKRVRVDLNHLGIWFADPAGDDGCFHKKGGGKVTPFDGDGKAGVQAFNSANILPAAPLP